MNVGELKEYLENIPDDAKVYVEADHGQSPEPWGYMETTSSSELPYDGEEIAWNEPLIMCDVTAIKLR